MSSENQVLSDASQQTTAATTPATTSPSSQEQVRLVDTVIRDQNIALNVLVSFVGVAQKRGCFALDESAKLY